MQSTATPDPVSDDSAFVPRTLVVPLDGSDYAARALTVARRFAAMFGGEVTLLTTPHSIDQSTWGETPVWLSALAAEPAQEVPARTVVAPSAELVDAVIAELAAHPGAAVCTATHARGAIGSSALGDVAQEMVRRIGCPILLVGRHCVLEGAGHGPLVVAHDGSRAADAALAPARAWARACDVPIVLVHAYQAPDVPRPDAVLDDACRRLGPSARLEVVHASFAAGAIRDLAHELDASLVALATHGQTGAGAVPMGRVASWVTRESPCPVLAVRPTDLAG